MNTGCPRKLVFDTAFDCTSINAILSTLNILSGTSWPYSHNGVLAERPIGYIVAAIRTMLSHVERKQGFDLKSITPSLFYHAIAAYNASPIPGSHGITPFLAEHGRPYVFPGITSQLAHSDPQSHASPADNPSLAASV